MLVNGIQLPNPDVADVLFMEKLEREQDLVTKTTKSSAGKTRAQIMRTQCVAIFNFFDNMFGDGTSKKVFGEKVNLVTCAEAYEQALTEIDRLDLEQASRLRGKYEAKYAPQTKKKFKKNHYNHHKPKRR